MRIKGLTGLAVRIEFKNAPRKEAAWLRSQPQGQTLSSAQLLETLKQRPLFDLGGLGSPFELACVVADADAPELRALLEALLDLAVEKGGRGELASFALDGEVRCWLWEDKKRALSARHSDPRVKTDFILLQKHRREAALAYVPPRKDTLRCACGVPVEPEAVVCASCECDFTTPIGIEVRPEDPERLRPMRARLMELKIPLPEGDLFVARVLRPRNAFEALTYEALMPGVGLQPLSRREMKRRVELLSELERWPVRYRLPGQTGEWRFTSWCSGTVRQARPSARKVLERLAKEQGDRFEEIKAVSLEESGWRAAGEVSGSSLFDFASDAEVVAHTLDFIQRFDGDRVELAAEYLVGLQRLAPDLLTAKERKRCEQYLDECAVRFGTGFWDYLKRRGLKAKSSAHALAAVLKEAGDPDAEDTTPRTLKDLSRGAVEWLADGRRPEVEDVKADWLVRELEALKRSKALPKILLQRAEEARRFPAPFGLTGALYWDVQPAPISEEDLKARAACPECNRRVQPTKVFHIPSLDADTEARTLRLYECEPCDRALLFARAVKQARSTRARARAVHEHKDANALGRPLPTGFVKWRHARFVSRRLQDKPLALQLQGLPRVSEAEDSDMDLRCGHPFVRIRIHAHQLDLQPGFGGGVVMGQLCMTPGCKKPDVRTARDD
ncbi:hypothetical protein HUW62_06560 [Myxococcus sp. AM011]|uniref:hypothetical protein n=1 Tax=Myxococcus sp. AM011 TaxID=2745200 RepID=UPI0015954885|nr:hypothetical protein [Myxococcus sp. AM011]